MGSQDPRGRRDALSTGRTALALGLAAACFAPAPIDAQAPSRGEFLGTARYSNFRRFQVRTDQDIDVPPPTPR